MAPPLARMGRKIIQIWLDKIIDVVEGKVHYLLKGCSEIFQTEWHFLVHEGTPRTNKSRFMLVFWLDLDLIISEKSIHKRKYFATRTRINDLIYKGSGVVVLGTHFI